MSSARIAISLPDWNAFRPSATSSTFARTRAENEALKICCGVRLSSSSRPAPTICGRSIRKRRLPAGSVERYSLSSTSTLFAPLSCALASRSSRCSISSPTHSASGLVSIETVACWGHDRGPSRREMTRRSSRIGPAAFAAQKEVIDALSHVPTWLHAPACILLERPERCKP